MQNTVRWSSDRLDGAVVGSFWGTPSQTKVMFISSIGRKGLVVAYLVTGGQNQFLL